VRSGLALLLAFAALYVFTFPENFSEAEDAVYYVERVATGTQNWHPNHLLLEPLGRLVFLASSAFGNQSSPLVVMQLLSLFASLTTLAMVFGVATHVSRGPALPFAATCAVGLSFGPWLYGMYPDAYILPLPFMLAVLWLLFGQAKAMAQERLHSGFGVMMTGIFAGFATLFHQQHVFLAISAAFCLAYFALRMPLQLRSGAFRLVAIFCMAYAFVVAVPYLYVGFVLLEHGSLIAVLRWSTGLAVGGLWTPTSLDAPALSALGLGTAIWSPVFVFSDTQVAIWVGDYFHSKFLDEERFFAQTGLLAGFWVILVTTAISVFAFLALVVAGKFATRRTVANDYIGVYSIVLWFHVIVSAIAITFWEPTNKEFWIALLPSIFLLLFLNTDLENIRNRFMSVLFLSTLFLANLMGAMVGFSDRSTDYWYTQNRYLIENAQDTDAIVDSCGYICTGYLQLFSRAEILDVEDISPDILSAQAGRIIVTSRAFEYENILVRREDLKQLDTRFGLTSFELIR